MTEKGKKIGEKRWKRKKENRDRNTKKKKIGEEREERGEQGGVQRVDKNGVKLESENCKTH